MNKYLRIAAILILFCILTPVFSQEDGDLVPDADPADELERAPVNELSLYEKTMIKDIETASYYELVAWCRSLELSDGGDSVTLRNSLFKYYELSPSKKRAEDSNASIITVRSAYNTDYFTVEENDQQMIVLKGDVEVEMAETGSNPRTHIIKAEELIFNQSEQIITARGNLKYTLISSDSEDIFYGDSLDFSVSSWSGLIFKGTSLRDEEVEGKDQTFYFNGNILKKSGKGGIFVLDDGLIKTQDRDDPDFHLKANKLWLMGPKEWGILSGVLYVGHVPLLYIPFYFKPGNELIFNPVIGTKSGKGTFVQTTTYLMGQKVKSDDDDSSFFNLGGNSDNYVLVREGLYLFKEESSDRDPANDDHLKFMADWYGKLGAFSGLNGSFGNHGQLKKLDFNSGIAVSRNVDSAGNIYFEDDEGNYVSQWNSTVVGNTEIPFRWGSDLTFTAGDFNADLSFYSDPFFNEDFMDREENFDWLNSILTSDDSADRIPETVTDMDWIISYSRTFQPEFMKPFLNTIAISPVRMNLDWSRRDNDAVDSSLSPSRVFFYPEKLNLPYASITFSGKPVSYSTNDGWGWSSDSIEEEDDERESLTPPWDRDEEEKKDVSEKEEGGLIAAAPWSSLFSNSSPQLYKGSLSYSYKTDLNIEGFTDNEDWTEPGHVNFKMEESYFLSNNRVTTTVDNSFLDSRIVLTNNNSYTNNYRNHLKAFGLDDSDVEYSQKLSDYQARSIDWNNAFKSTVYPMKYNKLFGATNFTYNLDNQLYKKTFDSYVDGEAPQYDEVWAKWDNDTINQHKAAVSLKYDGGYLFASSDSNYNLPPLEPREAYTNSVGYDVFNWRTSLSQTSVREEEEWTFQPFILSSVYKPHEKITIDQSLEYDIDEKGLTKSITSISVFGLYSNYTHEYTTPYNWDLDENSWVAAEDAFVPSKLNVGYKYELNEWTFWKNRMKFATNVDISWNSNLQQFNTNSLSLAWGFNYHIHEFLDLKFTMSSKNKNMYLYFEQYRDKLGIQENYNFWEDLFKSVNFFSKNQEDRYASNFNLDSINLELVHHLRDWDLTFLYSGSPKLEDKAYKWYSEFSIAVVWNPIPQIKSLVQRKGEDWTVDNR